MPIYHSRDLVHWRQIGHCLTRPSQLPLARAAASAGIYAPTIRYHDGRFYMITTNCSQGGNFIVSTDDPAGEWSEPVWVDQPGIDPSLLFDDDGAVYFTGTGITQFRIDPRTGKALSEKRTIWSGTGGKCPEGPHLYKIRGRYYLMLAEGGTEYGHMETIARSDQPFGPFEACPCNPILSHRSLGSPIQCTGHADLLEDHHGQWWLVFLGTRPQGYPPRHHLGRETFLAPVRWTDDGWPVVGDQGQVAIEMTVDSLLPSQPLPKSAPRDNFDSPRLGLEWNFLRNPRAEDLSLSECPGSLRLRGSAVTLDQEDSPAWVGRRQEHLQCQATAELHFAASSPNEEAGLTVLMNHRHHYEIALGQGRVFVRRRIGSLQTMVAEAPCAQDRIQLRIDADALEYRFAWSADSGSSWNELARGETCYLATEVAGGFTGVYFAMYATGNGRPCRGPADFAWFAYASTALEDKCISENLMPWRVSRVLPLNAPIAQAAYAGQDEALGWESLRASANGFVNVHSRSGDCAGMVYLATRIEAPTTGEWTLHLGHDGGCRLFLDRQAVFAEPQTRNPAIPGRSSVRLALSAGAHEILIAFDLAGGRGWGIFACFEAHPAAGAPAVFPQAL